MKSQALLAAALFLAMGAARADDGVAFGVGADYSTGDYGSDTTTKIWSVPFNARYTSGDWVFKASLPWLRVDGDVGVIPGLGNVGNSNPQGRGNGHGKASDPTTPTTTTTETGSASGIGDLRLSATYAFDTGGPLGIDLTGNVKIATADEDKALGTGANDYGLALDLYQAFGDTLVFGGVGYTLLGDSEFIDTNGVFNANVGASWHVGPGDFGAMYDWRAAASETADDRSEITGFYSVKAGASTKWQFYATRGLSDGSPEWGGGITVTQAF